MKLVDCLKAGRICGLEYVGEALDTILMHKQVLFLQEEMFSEEDELILEFEILELSDSDTIEDVLREFYGIEVKDIDDELERDLTELNKKLPKD